MGAGDTTLAAPAQGAGIEEEKIVCARRANQHAGRVCYPLFSDGILRVIGRQGASVLVRVMGLILCSLAVEIVLTALAVAGWAPVAPR